jgi:hypothetical protein
MRRVRHFLDGTQPISDTGHRWRIFSARSPEGSRCELGPSNFLGLEIVADSAELQQLRSASEWCRDLAPTRALSQIPALLQHR